MNGTFTTFLSSSVCVCVCFFTIYSGRQVRWMSQPGSHRRKVTQDLSSTFLLQCTPLFFSREEFSRSFPSSTVKSNLCTNDLIVIHLLGIYIYIFHFLVRKTPVTGIRTHVPTCQKVTRLLLSYRGDRSLSRMFSNGIKFQHKSLSLQCNRILVSRKKSLV